MPTDTPQQDPIAATDNNNAPAGAPLTSGLAQSFDTGVTSSAPLSGPILDVGDGLAPPETQAAAPPAPMPPASASESQLSLDGAGDQPPLTVEDRVRAILGQMLDPFEQRIQKLEAKHGFLSEELDHLFKLFRWPRKPR